MYTELKRKVSIVSITEEGLFHENEMPAGYDGAFLNVEVVHSIMFVDEFSNFHTLLCAAPKAKNSARVETPYKKNLMKMIEAPAGEKNYTDETGETYDHFLPEALKTKMNKKIEDIKTITENSVIPI